MAYRLDSAIHCTKQKTNIEKEEQVIDAEDEDFFGDV
jgi:hypothetical protein